MLDNRLVRATLPYYTRTGSGCTFLVPLPASTYHIRTITPLSKALTNLDVNRIATLTCFR